MHILTFLEPCASSVSSLKIASADRLHRDLYGICILCLFLQQPIVDKGIPSCPIEG